MKPTAKIRIAALALGACALVAASAPLHASEATQARPAKLESIDPWVARLEGGWYGDDNQTPMGRMGFAMLFERQPDGSFESHSALNEETWINLKLFQDQLGRWMLRQSASLEGLGEQSSVLEPVAQAGEMRRWQDPERPEFLQVDMGYVDDSLLVNVLLRGKPHAQFKLDAVPEAELGAMRASFKEGRGRKKEEASIYSQVGNGQVPSAIQAARTAIAADPESGQARMQLADALIEIIQSDGAQAPRYAGELLATLHKAVELDPKLPEAYQGLAGYYMNAPPIAGGSMEKAKQMIDKLAELDPPRAAALEVEMKRVAERN